MSFKLKIAGAAVSVLAAALATPLAMAQWPLPSIGDHAELVNYYKGMEAGGQKAPESEAHVVPSPRPSFNDNPEHYRDVAGVVPPVAGCPSETHVVWSPLPSFNDNTEHYREVRGTGTAGSLVAKGPSTPDC